MVKYLLPSTTLKRNPYDLVKHARNDLMLGKETPVWFKTINQFPMAPAALSRPDPLKNGSFCLEILKRNDGTFNRLSTKYYTEARHIKYPEDKTRQLFYKSHPFELVNPLNLVQDENEMRPYSTPPVPDATLTDFKIDGAVRGESVVLYTEYLMTQPVNKNDPNVLRERPEAYRMALREFYEFKAKQELSEELLKWQRKQDLEANPEKDVQRTGKDGKVVEKRDYSKPYSNGFLYHESKTVEKSAVFEMEQMERNRIQKEQFQKISSFEKAVPQSASGVSDYKKSRPMISIQPSKSPASIQRKPSAPKNDLIGLLNKKRAAS